MPKPWALPKGVPSLPALPTEELDFESLLHLGHKESQPGERVTSPLFLSLSLSLQFHNKGLRGFPRALTQVEKKEGAWQPR